MLADVFLEVLVAVLEEEVQVVACLLHVKELHDVRVLQVLQRFVLLLHTFDEVAGFALQQFLYILLLYNFDCVGLAVILVLVCAVGASETPAAQALLHPYHVAAHLLVLFLRFIHRL